MEPRDPVREYYSLQLSASASVRGALSRLASAPAAAARTASEGALGRGRPALERALDRTQPGPTILAHAAAQELFALLEAPAGQRDARRCAEICEGLHFFRRLFLPQREALLKRGALLRVLAAQLVEREGDLEGSTFVVLSGSVAIRRRCDDIGGRFAFVRTVYDGKAFGDGWDSFGSSPFGPGRREVDSIAQEDCVLFQFATEDYVAILGKEPAGPSAMPPAPKSDHLRSLFFLQDCSPHELSVLTQLMEPQWFSYGECVFSAGQRPKALCLLTRGSCALRVPKAGRALHVSTLHPGDCFGHGCMSSPLQECPYTSRVEVVVESSTAELQLLAPRHLVQLAHETLLKVAERLQNVEDLDPICQGASEALDKDQRWSRTRRQTLKLLGVAERSCSAGALGRSGARRRTAPALPWRTSAKVAAL